MRFFKENSDSIIKLFINQLGIGIFSFFLYTAAGSLEEKIKDGLALKICISVFAISFYFVLIYNVAWEIGAKDKIRIDGKRMERNAKKGILLGVYANIPNFIVVGISMIFLAVYLTTGSEWAKTTFALIDFGFRFFLLPTYVGVIQGITSVISSENTALLVGNIMFLIFPALAAVITHVSYVLGLNDFRFFATSRSHKKS